MSYPPQQPENGWSDQQPVDPFAQGNAVPPAPPQADAYGQQPPQHPQYPDQAQQQQQQYQAQPPVYYPEQPGYPPSDQTQSLPPRAPGDPNPYPPPPPAPDPHAQQYHQQAAPQSGYPQAQPLADPFAAQQAEQPFPQAPISASPASAQPASGQPFSAQPYTPPGVPESPFAAAPTHNPPNMPTPVSASPISGQPWANTPGMPQFVPRKPRRGLPGWVYVIGAIVIVAALAVGGVVWLGADSGGGPGGDKASGQASASDDGGDKDPKTKDEPAVVTDKGSNLSFEKLPDPWEEAQANDLTGTDSATGQVYEADKGVSGYFAACELNAKDVKYTGGDVVDAGKAWASLLDESAWVDGNGKRLKGLDRKANPKYYNFRVDGHKAYYMTYGVKWKSDKVEEKGAEVIIGVVDIDGKKAAGFLAILPDSLVDKQKPVIKDTMLTLRFAD